MTSASVTYRFFGAKWPGKSTWMILRMMLSEAVSVQAHWIGANGQMSSADKKVPSIVIGNMLVRKQPVLI